MSFIELDELGDVKEGKAHPEGVVDLVVRSADEYVKEETGRTVIKTVIAIEDGTEDWLPIQHYISMPLPDEEEGTRKMFLRGLKRFLVCFNVPFERNGFAVEDISGSRTSCFIRQTEPNDNNDVYNEIVLPKLPDDE